MYLLRRLFRSQVLANGKRMRMGDIVAMSDVLHPVELVPVFGSIMDRRLDCNNSLELPDTFYLNNFSDKDTHHHFTYNFAWIPLVHTFEHHRLVTPTISPNLYVSKFTSLPPHLFMSQRPHRIARNPQAEKERVWNLCANSCNPRNSEKVLPTPPTSKTAKVSVHIHRVMANPSVHLLTVAYSSVRNASSHALKRARESH